ncbi:ComF family protein [Treponema sp. HNW]|uniref:ComF family protein n=1 Tax=Treponema sp. HNW TaxID=3116654 RepID=UPI003D0A2C5B
MGLLFKTLLFIRSAAGHALALLLPPQTCVSCGKESLYLPVCISCREEMKASLKEAIEATETRCKRCGRILISEKEICLECRESDTIACLDGVFPLYPYVLWKKKLLFLWKTEGLPSLSPFFASLVYEAWKTLYPGIPLVPVPPRPGKIFREGRDQIDELSRCMQGLYGLPVFKVLKRLSSRQQKKLSRAERLSRTEKRYALKPAFLLPTSFKASPPEAAVLVDDIITTGATLEICAELLKQAGIKRVYAITLFSC